MAHEGIDPGFLPYLDMLPVALDLATLDGIAAVRIAREEMFPPGADPRPDVERSDMTIPGPAGAPDVPIRIHRPRAEAEAEASQPVFLEIHGGGFIIGSPTMVDPFCDRVAAEAGAVVVSVDYRLAPENPYPAAVEDCFAALVWVSEHAEELNVDPRRISIGGQSAGGGLAAATVLLARDRGGPEICFQLLEIPELDDRLTTGSMREYTDTPVWNRPNAEWSWKHYLADLHGGDVPPFAAPAREVDLSGLPPAFVSVMQFDPLRDEGIEYARRLMQAGVPTELHAYPGTFHGSNMLTEVEVSRRGTADSVAAVVRALSD